ncbi:MAG: cold-shock protein [Rufibacter sp.]
MARSQNSFMKKQLEQKRLKKKKDKEERKQARQENSTGGNLEDMIMYVDENGNFSSTPPEKKIEKKPAPDAQKPR